MSKMDYLKNKPIAVLGGGAVGKTCAADMKLAGCEVRLYDIMPYAQSSLKDLDVSTKSTTLTCLDSVLMSADRTFIYQMLFMRCN